MFSSFNNRIIVNFRYHLLVWGLAAILALTATLGQAALGKVLGVELTSVVKACQMPGGGGC